MIRRQKKAPKAAKTAKGAEKKAKAAKTTTPKVKRERVAAGAREGSKTEAVLALMKRKQGATIDELVEATGWKKNSVFGFISGTIGKKLGNKVESTKGEDKVRRYQIAA